MLMHNQPVKFIVFEEAECQKNKDTKKCFKIICMVHTCTIDVHHCTQYNLFWSITIKNCFNSGCLQCSYSVVYFMHNAKAQGMIFCLTHLGNKTKLISAKMFFYFRQLVHQEFQFWNNTISKHLASHTGLYWYAQNGLYDGTHIKQEGSFKTEMN